MAQYGKTWETGQKKIWEHIGKMEEHEKHWTI